MAYNNRGAAFMNKGEYDEAIADLDKAIELSPEFAMAYSNRGAAYINKGEYDKAISDSNKAIKLRRV
jgi:tetratricopeptide (TPR) repeat protein